MNMKRMRGRNNRGGNGGGGGGGGGPQIRHQGGGGVPLNRNHVFDSNGPDLRIRGTAQQLFEKYLQLGRDATGGGDRVMAESYFQHAEHYFRILNVMAQAQQAQQAGLQQGQQGGQTRGPRQFEANGPEAVQGTNEGAGEDEEAEPQAIVVQPAYASGQHGQGQHSQGLGEQPGGEPREIPISAAPPEG